RRRAVLLVGTPDGVLDQVRLESLAAHHEVEVDLREDLGVGLRPFGVEPDLAAADRLAALAQDQDDVVGGAAAGAQEHHFHGTGGDVVPAALGGAVHDYGIDRKSVGQGEWGG